ncbi:macro domain-containing protein [Lentibacillus amyloliquefaciens]|uniref:type II toxin-antitoxin system antitoxin DNA ADP-ribosyl glycohydrolase DarG n=1 Tax=Lentibacillus amyloliquefaciens TaxID=1472767 RepID=UPI000A79398E|nr:macro domain-containing protein [Lentibacillus amyloliquefaciens]
MITYKHGNLLEDSAEALVNTVNTVGVMGKGIALQFKQAFPEVFQEYEKACKRNEITIGKMHVVPIDGTAGPRYVINFPTKKHWKENSKKYYIEDGLENLVKVVHDLGLSSIALPPLGCRNGGLEWTQVKTLIEKAFEGTNVNVHVYEPMGSPAPGKMKVRTKKPEMTEARALLLASINNYKGPGYKLTVLEIQKIAYFLQEAGEQLRLNFKKYKYGPYAENLNHVLQRLEGHFIRGYGDRSRQSDIQLINSAGEKAYEFLETKAETVERLNRVNNIMNGFETPYGLELLATVH